MSERSTTLKALCQTLKLPTVAREAMRLAEEAIRQGLDPLTYLIGVALSRGPRAGGAARGASAQGSRVSDAQDIGEL
jgi:hypothetical protein